MQEEGTPLTNRKTFSKSYWQGDCSLDECYHSSRIAPLGTPQSRPTMVVSFLIYWNGCSFVDIHDANWKADVTVFTHASGSWCCGASWKSTWCTENIATKELLPIVIAVVVCGVRNGSTSASWSCAALMGYCREDPRVAAVLLITCCTAGVVCCVPHLCTRHSLLFIIPASLF